MTEGGGQLIECPHTGPILLARLQSPHTPVTQLRRQVGHEAGVLRPPQLQHEGHGGGVSLAGGVAVHGHGGDGLVGDGAVDDRTGRRDGDQLEDAGTDLSSNVVLRPTQEVAVVHLRPGDEVHRAVAPVHPHLVLLDVDHLLAGVEDPVEGQVQPGVGVHLAGNLHLGVESHLVLGGQLGAGADWLV